MNDTKTCPTCGLDADIVPSRPANGCLDPWHNRAGKDRDD